MIIYIVEPSLDSQLQNLLASFKDFFLVVQFLNFLTTPTGKKPGLHLILWVTTLIKYQITEQTMCKHWFVYKAASMVPQHPALFPSWLPASSARELWLQNASKSQPTQTLTVPDPYCFPNHTLKHRSFLLSSRSRSGLHKSLISFCQWPQSRASTWGWLFWAHQMALSSFHGGIITCTCPEEIILRSSVCWSP